jgi:uncharacterized protein
MPSHRFCAVRPAQYDTAMAASSKSAFTRLGDFFYERMRHNDAWSTADTEPTSGFASLSGHKYALLISYRRDGEGVPFTRVVRSR